MDVKLFVFGKKTHLLCMEVHVIHTMINMNFPERKSRKMKKKKLKLTCVFTVINLIFDIIWSNCC